MNTEALSHQGHCCAQMASTQALCEWEMELNDLKSDFKGRLNGEEEAAPIECHWASDGLLEECPCCLDCQWAGVATPNTSLPSQFLFLCIQFEFGPFFCSISILKGDVNINHISFFTRPFNAKHDNHIYRL